MSRVNDFCDAIGLTESIRAWLRNHPGDRLREEIILRLNAALAANCAAEHVPTLRMLIHRVHAIFSDSK